MGKRIVSVTSLVVALLGLGPASSAQTTYTWTQTGAGGNWSTATWDASTPVEASDTIIRFFAGTSGAANTVTADFTATNNIETGGVNGTSFDLESLILSGTGTSRTITIGPTGTTRVFRFVGDANSISFETGSSLSYKIGSNIAFTNGLTISSSNTNAATKELNGTISGSGGLTINGTGRFTINGNNSYTGGTTINSGTVLLGHDGALGAGTLTLNGGLLSNSGLFASGDPGTNSRDLAVNVVFGGEVQIMNSSGIQGGNYSLGSSTKTLDLGGVARVIATDSTTTGNTTSGSTISFLGAVINGGLTKTGRGGLRMAHSNSSYTGVTTVRMGILYVAGNALPGENGTLGNATSAVEIGDASTSSANTLRMYISGGDFEVGRDINVNNFNGTGVTSIGGSGDINATYSGQIALNRDVELLSASVGGNAVHFTGDITGNFGVSVGGTGTVRFANAKSYTGATTVAAGTTLQVDGSTATTSVSVAGTLKGTGSTAAVTLASTGTLAPGAGIGTIATGTLDMTAGGTLAVEIDTDQVQSDRVAINGDLLLAGNSAVLALTDLGTDVPTGVMVLATYTGTWDGGIFAGLADDSPFVFGSNTYTINYNDTVGGFSAVTIVPEPGSLALLGLAAAGLLGRRRRAR